MKIKKFNNYALLKESTSSIEEIKDMIDDVKYAFIDFADDNNLIIKLKHFDKVNWDSPEITDNVEIDYYIKSRYEMYMRSGKNLYDNYCLDIYINIVNDKSDSDIIALEREHLEIITNNIMPAIERLDVKYKVDINLSRFYDLTGYNIHIIVKKK